MKLFIAPADIENKKTQKSKESHNPEDDNPEYIKKILPIFKQTANIITTILMIVLVLTIAYKLYMLLFVDFFGGDFPSVINDLLLILILMELFTILYSYLKKQYIKVERVIELGVISIVRELLFRIDHYSHSKIYAISVLLVALGIIFFIEKYYSTTRNR